MRAVPTPKHAVPPAGGALGHLARRRVRRDRIPARGIALSFRSQHGVSGHVTEVSQRFSWQGTCRRPSVAFILQLSCACPSHLIRRGECWRSCRACKPRHVTKVSRAIIRVLRLLSESPRLLSESPGVLSQSRSLAGEYPSLAGDFPCSPAESRRACSPPAQALHAVAASQGSWPASSASPPAQPGSRPPGRARHSLSARPQRAARVRRCRRRRRRSPRPRATSAAVRRRTQGAQPK